MSKLLGNGYCTRRNQERGYSTYEKQVRLDYCGKFSLVCLERSINNAHCLERVVFTTSGRLAVDSAYSSAGVLFWALVSSWLDGSGGEDILDQMEKLF
jgi:hypothetical protein